MLESREPKYVNERKFSGNAAALKRVFAIVEAACLPDGEYAEGVVNSIYFETPRFSSYLEKANGDNIKTKVRLRWYGRDGELAPEVPAFLEIKGRIGAARDKHRIELRAPRGLLLETPFETPGLCAFLVEQLPRLAIPSPLSWRPSCLISYSRRRYVDIPTSSRVSIDWDIRCDRFNRSIFPSASPVALDCAVCEFKNRFGEPPRWAEAVSAAGMAYGGFSKYGEITSRLLQGEC